MKPRRMLGVVIALAIAAGAFAQDMPDPSLIHGRAIPAQELPNGTVTVRVVREAIGNNAPDQQVSLTVGGRTRTATTDEAARRTFRRYWRLIGAGVGLIMRRVVRRIKQEAEQTVITCS